MINLVLLLLLATVTISDRAEASGRAWVLARAIRIALVAGGLVWMATFLEFGPVRRGVLADADRVEAVRDRAISEYHSGVLTMAIALEAHFTGVWRPLLLLAWMGVLPAIRPVRGGQRAGSRAPEA